MVTTSDYLKKKVRSRLAVSMNKRRDRHRPCSFAAKKSQICFGVVLGQEVAVVALPPSMHTRLDVITISFNIL